MRKITDSPHVSMVDVRPLQEIFISRHTSRCGVEKPEGFFFAELYKKRLALIRIIFFKGLDIALRQKARLARVRRDGRKDV